MPCSRASEAPRLSATPRPLTLRALNRATLARQMLLAREKTTPLRAIERLVALQAQLASPPFVALWSRLEGFERADLLKLIRRREVVRATTLRGTLHVLSAKDYVALRAAMQPALTLGLESILRVRAKGLDVDGLVAAGRKFFAKPHHFDDFRATLEERDPKADIRAMAYAVRLHLPLVQTPEETAWGWATAAPFTLAEKWIGEPLAPDAGPGALVLRYLAAYGPATAADMQAWSALPPAMVRDAFAALRPKLVALRDERKRELFDLPKAPRPGEPVEAPVRFLPEFDSLLLSHADRRRVVADAHRKAIYLPGLRVAPTFLVDGCVAGTWKAVRAKGAVTMALEPFAAPPRPVRDALVEEGERLLRFLEPDARTFDVRVSRSR